MQPPPHFCEYERLAYALHALLLHGKGDTEEADAVRDQMDAPWHACTPAEQECLRTLHGALYELVEGVRFPHLGSDIERFRERRRALFGEVRID